MAHLPWLVVHGLWAFRAVVAAGALAGVIGAWLRVRVRARRNASAARAALGEAVTRERFAPGEVVTVAGSIRVEGEAWARFEDGAPAAAVLAAVRGPDGWVPAAAARAEQLALADEQGAQILVIEGPIEVIAGAREVHGRVRLAALPGAVTDRVVAALLASPAGMNMPPAHREIVLRSIADGGRVLARGVLRRRAERRQPEGYRDTQRPAWSLEEEGGAPVLVAARQAPRVEGPAWRRLAASGAIGALACAAALTLTGEVALRFAARGYVYDGHDDRERHAAEGPARERMAARAAASALHRREALTTMGYLLLNHHPVSAERDEAAAALVELRDD
jgi:hypothetical protein